jgi:glutathione peroxidase
MSKFYDFSLKTLTGETLAFSQFKGKKVLVVNTASKCGLTPQYQQLEELHEEFGGANFVVLGIPSNDFNGQEPGTNKDIQDFCQVNYGVTFLMTEKISVKGKNAHPLYHWLTDAIENGISDFEVTWNFHKFMIDENGNLERDLPPTTSPLDEQIINWIK